MSYGSLLFGGFEPHPSCGMFAGAIRSLGEQGYRTALFAAMLKKEYRRREEATVDMRIIW